MGQPIEVDGKPHYPVMLIDKNGAHTGPAFEKDGSVLRWTFDPNNNPVMNKAREKAVEHAKDVEIAKRRDAVELEYDTLVNEAKRAAGPSAVKLQRIDYADLRKRAEQTVATNGN